jgi:hypothetical protein
MTDLGNYFHPHLVLPGSMKVYSENTGTFFKVILLEQPIRISFWAFPLILSFSRQG